MNFGLFLRFWNVEAQRLCVEACASVQACPAPVLLPRAPLHAFVMRHVPHQLPWGASVQSDGASVASCAPKLSFKCFWTIFRVLQPIL